MKTKEEAKKLLNYFSYLYLALGAITIIFGIICLISPDFTQSLINTKFSSIDFKEYKPAVILFVGYLIECLVYLWQYWLIRRLVTGKTKGTFLFVLLIVSIVIAIFNLFSSFDISMLLGLLVDLNVLQLVYKVRQQK